ncbi:S-layer homology domain-containing protein [Candidatus Peregrinibacteria bacterium]|nr:MAG: S-layer homology domain-containing protein [Candidatus Peregrinibacteria bacterium]
MKKIFALFTGLLLVFGNFSTPFVHAAFLDVEESPYVESILFLQEQGVLQGYGDGTFRPEAQVNRAEFLKIVFAALGETTEEVDLNCFPDVKEEWFAPYVCRAKALGIAQGYPDGLYHPEQSVNLVEAFKISIQAFGLPHAEAGEQWYEPYADFVHVNGIFSKYAYFPNELAQRDEMAFMVHQMLRLYSGVQDFSRERRSLSAGCGLDAPSSAPSTFMVDGIERAAIVSVPSHYDKNTPIPLLFAFHGRTSPNTLVKSYYGFERAGEGEAIFVYPAGLRSGSSFTWSNSGDRADTLRDYAFFDVMFEELTQSYCIDLDEVYAAGHSLGGWFVNSLACARGDVLRGVATLGGARSTGTCSGPVAAMQWHNPDDTLASFSSGLAARDDYLEQNVCSTESDPVEPTWGNCVEYRGCLEDAPVLFCPHGVDYDEYSGEYYPHTWPRQTGGEMWDFLRGL